MEMNEHNYPKGKTENEWKEKLDNSSFSILRQKGTEAPFSGTFNIHSKEGVYVCKGCDTPLFNHEGKFDSGCGWPSFDREIKSGVVQQKLDQTHGMTRMEILCSQCGGHLGHIFPDGPTSTGVRYCVNSGSLDFKSDV